MSSGLEWVRGICRATRIGCQHHAVLRARHGGYAASKPLSVAAGHGLELFFGNDEHRLRMIRDVLGSREEYWAFPRRELFNKIGMRSAVLGDGCLGDIYRIIVSLCNGPRLRSLRLAFPERRRLAGSTHPSGRLGRLYNYPGARSPQGPVWRPFLAEQGEDFRSCRPQISTVAPGHVLCYGLSGTDHSDYPLPQTGHRPAGHDIRR